MKRMLLAELLAWKSSSTRKPLILRGARQVGKTYIVRELGRRFKHFVEINFEASPSAKAIFAKQLEPEQLIRDLSLLIEQPIIPGETLLFLDEIQETPAAINALRYFYEKLPNLHVISAGSLLEFALEQVGIPVGRVEFLYMYPMSFIEFVATCSTPSLLKQLTQRPFEPFSPIIHEKMLTLLGYYTAVGGMPEAIRRWKDTQDLTIVQNTHRQLAEAFIDDFEKYAKKTELKYIALLFKRIPQLLGERFVYKNISDSYRKRELEPCFDLLEKAGVAHRIYASSGQGLPLGAEAALNIFKPLFLDIALAQTILGISLKEWILNANQALINKGNIIEAMIGQELLALADPRFKQQLYYWQRMERSSNAEVDYLVQSQQNIIPVEVKSGKIGHLKSMHQFLEKYPQTPYGIRLSSDTYHQYNKIMTYPLYALCTAFEEMRQRVATFVEDIE
jgi:predicted AAA+ superfamily ATPase